MPTCNRDEIESGDGCVVQVVAFALNRIRYLRAIAWKRGMLGEPGGLPGLDGLRPFRSRPPVCCTVIVCRKSTRKN